MMTRLPAAMLSFGLALAALAGQPPAKPADPATPAAPTTPAPAAPTKPSVTPTPPSANIRPLLPPPPPPALPPGVNNVPYAQFKVELPMIQRNVIRDITGRMGGMAMDVEKNILYVAASAANVIEVHNVANSKSIQTLKDQESPNELVFIPESRTLVASCGADSSCRVFKADETGALTPGHRLSFAGETGPLIYDAAAKLCWVGHGVFISSFDPADGSKKSEISLDGIGRPVAIVAENSGPRLYVITTPANEVVVIDRDKKEVTARWPLTDRAPAALALDELNGNLFIATRSPARLLMLDTADGSVLANVDGPTEPGSIWHDPWLRKVYIAGNQSDLWVYQQTARNGVARLAKERTAPGARTSLHIPAHRRLIVAAPNLGDDETARLFIYQIGP